MKQSVVSRNSEVMGGTPVFRGTRVPVQTLLDYLEAGDSIDEFLEGFPSVSRGQVIAFLEEAKNSLLESDSPRRSRENQEWLTGPPHGRELI
jgi:uncharacterized protein (DUF433 family)